MSSLLLSSLTALAVSAFQKLNAFSDLAFAGPFLFLPACLFGLLSVFTGSCGQLTCVDGNNDVCGSQSRVDFQSNRDQT
jgi:hypothetical protein